MNENLASAKKLYQAKNLIKAEKEFQKIFKEGTLAEQVEAAFSLEKIYCIYNYKFNKIKPYYDFIIKNGDDNFKGQAYMEIGIYYRGHKKYGKMAEYYQEALKYIPNDIRLITEVANYYLSQNDEESQDLAQAYFKRILEVNVTQKIEYKHLKNQNMAYIGLAKSLTKQRKIDEAEETLNLVVVQNAKDSEDLNKCRGNLAVWRGDYQSAISFYQNNLKSYSARIVYDAQEKIGIIYALMKNYDKAVTILGPLAKMPNRGNYANFILGKIYFYKKDYQKSYEAYMQASSAFDACLFYALKSAMFFDETKAVEIGNTIINNKELLIKYRAYLLYLSKEYNIFFANLNYCSLSNREEEMIEPNMLSIYYNAAHVYNSDYNARLEPFTLYEEDLEEQISNLPPNFYGGYYDSYYVRPNSQELKNMLIMVNTFKDTKTIFEIKIVAKEKVEALKDANIFNSQMATIRGLFR